MKTRLLLLPLLLFISAGGVACSKAEASTRLPVDVILRETLGITRNVSEIGFLLGINGSISYLGTISATTSAKNNADATTFTIPADARTIVMVGSAAVRYLPDTDATEDITTTNGFPLQAGIPFWTTLKPLETNVQAITDTSTSALGFWRLD